MRRAARRERPFARCFVLPATRREQVSASGSSRTVRASAVALDTQENATRSSTGELTVRDRCFAREEDPLNTSRIDTRRLESRFFRQALEIEDDQVSHCATSNIAAVGEAQALRRSRAQLAYGLAERECLVVACVARQKPDAVGEV